LDNFDNTGRKVCCKVHYIKTVSGKVVAQSIAFRAVLAGGQPFPPEIFRDVPDIRFRLAGYPAIFCYPVPDPAKILPVAG